MTLAFQFPGQGSQVVGMGASLSDAYPEARATFEEADEALGLKLSRLCREGPEEELKQTENAQPALLAHGVATARVLATRGMEPLATAGHSLGEFTAHVVAGSLEFADAVRLVRVRGVAMARAGDRSPGTMAAVIGMEESEVEALCREAAEKSEILVPANYNSPGQIVISGSEDAVRRAVGLAKDRGARLAVELQVSGAFHSPLMEPAAESLAGALESSEIRSPRIAVVANVDSAAVTDPAGIRRRLIEQLTGAVRWTDCVLALRELGARRFIEPGPGNVLTGLLRRIDRSLEGAAVGNAEQVEEVTQ